MSMATTRVIALPVRGQALQRQRTSLANAASQSAAFPTRERDPQLETLMQHLMAVPTIAQVWASPKLSDNGASRLQVTLSQKDVSSNKNVRFGRSVTVGPSGADVGLAMPLPECSSLSISPSGLRSMLVQVPAGGGKDPPTVVEVWGGARKLHETAIPASVHGPIYGDSFFGHGFVWSPCERYVIYAAQRAAKPAEAASANGSPPEAAAPGSQASASEAASHKKKLTIDSEYEEDWGELNTKARPPLVYVMDVHAGRVAALPGQADDVSYGQPTWTPEGGVVMVGWPHTEAMFPNIKKRLGIVYCFNRSCALYHCRHPLPPDWQRPDSPAKPAPNSPQDHASRPAAPDGEEPRPAAGDAAPQSAAATEPLLPQGFLRSCMEPRFSPDGKFVIWVSYDAACEAGTHYAGASLHAAAWGGGGLAADGALEGGTEVVGVVARPSAPGAFPGLYSQNLSASLLPARPFLGNSVVLLNTLWGSDCAVIAVDLRSRSVTRLTPPRASFTLHSHNESAAFAVRASLTTLPAIMRADSRAILTAAEGSGGFSLEGWSVVEGVVGADDVDAQVMALLQSVRPEVITVETRDGGGATASGNGGMVGVESLVYSNKAAAAPDAPPPAALFLHGGPHGAVAHAFVPGLLALLSQGFTVIAPNFRGSAGYGEDHLLALPGHAGSMDVGDCMVALEALVQDGSIDPARVVVVGGSHGGFLTGHLLGQHPNTFRCGALRNPVLDISLMVHLSDIPDWCFVETHGTGEAARLATALPPSKEAKALMLSKSPIAHVHNVRVPVLMFLGAKDRRVPPADGLAYAAALRGNGCPVRVHMYDEDTHALDRPQTMFDQWVGMIKFFRLHAPPRPGATAA